MPDEPQNVPREQPASDRPPIQLLLLGEFGLVMPDGTALSVPTKKNRALLAILALSPGRRMTREKLCGLLWSDRAEEQARSSLRQSLATLRKELGGAHDQIVQTRDDQVVLQPVLVDAEAIAQAADKTDIVALRAAASLCRGDLLADTTVRDDSFEHWLAGERRRLADATAAILERLALTDAAPERIVHAKRLVALDPLREGSHRILMEAYHAAGENGLALKQFETCRDLLKAELNTEPALQTVELRQRIGKAQMTAAVREAAKNKRETRSDVPSIAVLPFLSLSEAAEQKLLADGIAEDIITGLARFRQLSVVARNLSFRYRGDVDVIEVAKELAATYIVEGSLRRAADRLRITVQLISGETGKHLWADAYSVEGAELFEAQDQSVRKIVATLGGRVTDASTRHARLKPPGSLAAYELVLQANALNWESREAKAEARQMLEGALAIDPDYANAHSLLAAVTLREAAYHARLTMDVLDTCLAHARRAVEISDDDSSCHSILGWVLIARGEFTLAAEHLAHADRLNPNNPYVIINRGSLLNQTGHPDEAIACFEQAQAVDPYFNPSWLREKLGFAHFLAGRYAACVDHLTRASKSRFHMDAIKAAAHAMLGEDGLATQARHAALRARPDCTVEMVLSLLPCARAEDRNHLARALLRGGFPPGDMVLE